MIAYYSVGMPELYINDDLFVSSWGPFSRLAEYGPGNTEKGFGAEVLMLTTSTSNLNFVGRRLKQRKWINSKK